MACYLAGKSELQCTWRFADFVMLAKPRPNDTLE